jgi:hypothetical protein
MDQPTHRIRVINARTLRYIIAYGSLIQIKLLIPVREQSLKPLNSPSYGMGFRNFTGYKMWKINLPDRYRVRALSGLGSIEINFP